MGSVKLKERLKPSAPAAMHLLLAALLWTTVGTFLLYRGLAAVQSLPLGTLVAVVGVGALVGLVKGRYVLSPSARKGAARIVERGDGKCLGGFLSWKSWLFVLAMSLMGKGLRALSLPPWFIGALLTAVGVALGWGSAVYWRAFVARVRS